jgi:hypothetical protein
MKEVLNRLKSPVVIIQVVSIVASLVVTLIPELEGTVENVTYVITSIINVFAGLNNPTDKKQF